MNRCTDQNPTDLWGFLPHFPLQLLTSYELTAQVLPKPSERDLRKKRQITFSSCNVSRDKVVLPPSRLGPSNAPAASARPRSLTGTCTRPRLLPETQPPVRIKNAVLKMLCG